MALRYRELPSEGCFVSVWIGIENTNRETALHVISRSLRFGKSIQQVLFENAFKRGHASDEMVLGWARERDPHAVVVKPEMTDGQAILFDGKLWHGSNNTQREGRLALLFQYAAADTPVRIPDFGNFEWPCRFTDQRPPAISVSGQENAEANYLVPPPQTSAKLFSNFITARIVREFTRIGRAIAGRRPVVR